MSGVVDGPGVLPLRQWWRVRWGPVPNVLVFPNHSYAHAARACADCEVALRLERGEAAYAADWIMARTIVDPCPECGCHQEPTLQDISDRARASLNRYYQESGQSVIRGLRF